jgi:ATP-binding protein involved in chromosome partitioning
MGKNKLRKFDEMAGFPHVFQYPFETLQSEKGCPLKGKWNETVFKNDHPIVLELGCGRGEYTVGLGLLFPEKNFIGVDVKGARMWAGAKKSLEAGMHNVAFLRTNIELIAYFFAPGEVSEIWLTFPDPQMKKVNKRLTNARFMKLYREILSGERLIHLKTDSNFLYAYTCEMIKANHFPIQVATDNLYHSGMTDESLSIRTHYEQQWLERGLSIKYIRFVCEQRDLLIEPNVEIEPDSYRSAPRGARHTPAMEHRQMYPRLILDALKKVRYPGTEKNLVEAGMVEDNIRIDGKKVSFSLLFEKSNDPFIKSVVKAAETAILTYVSPDIDVRGNISVKTTQNVRPEPEQLLSEVKNILAVASGKGGVGKSTIAANLAVALAGMGYRTGLLDADIFGPSQPKMFHVEEAKPYLEKVGNRELIRPAENYGVKLLSIGFFVNKEDAVLWRGAMASNALRQLIGDGAWGTLDYLLIDLPPGTSDIHLTLVQTLVITGAVVVTTPQEVALADTRKGISMFTGDKVNVPVLGLIENMAWFTPAELPENKYYIFGRGGGERLADELNIPLLGQIPLVQSICESGDAGVPAALHPETVTGAAFRKLAENVVERVRYRHQFLAPTKRVEFCK